MQELALENESIKRQNTMMEKVLAVRDAILTAYRETTYGQPQRLEDLKGVGAGLALAIDDLNAEPGLSELCAELKGPPEQITVADDLGEELGEGSPVQSLQNGQQQPSSNGEQSSVPAKPDFQGTMMLSAALGETQILDGSSLERVENIPPPTNSDVAQAVANMQTPNDMVEYWRAWTMDLKAAWDEAYNSKFDPVSVAKLDECMGVMTQMWWHAAQLKPAYLAHLTYIALPENSGQLEQWALIAEKVYPELSEKDISVMREAWRQYTKRMAKTAIGAVEWANQLQQLAIPDDYAGLHATANQNLEVCELAARVASAVQEEYTASMEFLANQALALTMVQKAFMNYAAIPYMPDVSTIVYHILKIADKEPRQDVVITVVDDGAVSN